MDTLFGTALDLPTLVLLFLALGLALSFEFVNGFHDTANAVATVIYTHSLRPSTAVIWSGMWNFLGVLASSGAVAFGIIALLPVELIVNVGSGAGFAMVFALLLAAILWNLGTWYLGLPASSSHTLIGSIVGVGLMNSWLSPQLAFGEGVNWHKVQDVGVALLVSPLLGFCAAAILLLLMKAIIRDPRLYASPQGQPPPGWIRGLLVLTCTGVSFAHGSNDGQKGMGLIMLILIGVLPGVYALRLEIEAGELSGILASAKALDGEFSRSAQPAMAGSAAQELSRFLTTGKLSALTLPSLADRNRAVARALDGHARLAELESEQRAQLRKDIYLVQEAAGKLGKDRASVPDAALRDFLNKYRGQLKAVTHFIPTWVKVAVALALGLGTTVGWKRIVTTVGEKIGKAHLTYAQGASAELVAMTTIGAADLLGLPVSTTHVLSSGVAGAMLANHSGLQACTLRNLLLAWVLTLPVCVALGAGLFAMGLLFVFNILGMH